MFGNFYCLLGFAVIGFYCTNQYKNRQNAIDKGEVVKAEIVNAVTLNYGNGHKHHWSLVHSYVDDGGTKYSGYYKVSEFEEYIARSCIGKRWKYILMGKETVYLWRMNPGRILCWYFQ